MIRPGGLGLGRDQFVDDDARRLARGGELAGDDEAGLLVDLLDRWLASSA